MFTHALISLIEVLVKGHYVVLEKKIKSKNFYI